MSPDNFLAAESLLIARLRDVLPTDVHVLSAADLSGVADTQQPTPAVHVIYTGYQVADTRTGAAAAIDQQWLTIVVTRNVADIEQGFHARQAAGPLAAQVMDALYRHRLKQGGKSFGAGPLRMASAPAPGFLDGHFYLPLGWTVGVMFSGECCT